MMTIKQGKGTEAVEFRDNDDEEKEDQRLQRS